MRISQKLTRPVAVLAATAAVSAAFTAPALGNAALNVGTEIDGARPARQVIPAAQMVQLNRNLDLRTRNVALTCEGVSIGDAVTTRVTECALYVNSSRITNDPLALPGVLIASASVSQLVPVGASVYGCASVSTVWSDSTISPTRRTCTAAQIALA